MFGDGSFKSKSADSVSSKKKVPPLSHSGKSSTRSNSEKTEPLSKTDSKVLSTSENELKVFESVVSAHQLSSDGLISTKILIEKRLKETFDSFLSKFIQSNKANEIFVQVEKADETDLQFLVEKKEKEITYSMRIDDYLTMKIEEVKKEIIEDVANLLDDGLVADRRALSNVKKKIMEQMYASRDTIVLHRNAVEGLLTHRYSEIDRLTKISQKSSVLDANIILSGEIKALQSAYDTLWIVQLDSKEKLVRREETILQLNDNVQKSFESIYSLRENASIMSEKHEEQTEKLMMEIGRLSNKLHKKPSWNIMNKESPIISLMSHSEDEVFDIFDSSIVSGKTLEASCKEPSCKGCERLSDLVKDLKSALEFAREAVQISKDQKKRDAIKPHTVRKTSKVSGVESQTKRRSSKNVKQSQQSISNINEHNENEGGGSLYKIDEKVLSLFSRRKSSKISEPDRRKSVNRTSRGSASSRQDSRLSSESDTYSRHSSVNLEVFSRDEAHEALEHSDSSNNLTGRPTSTLRKSFGMADTEKRIRKSPSSPSNVHFESVQQLSSMDTLIDQYHSMTREATMAKVTSMAKVTYCSTQTDDLVDPLQEIYLEATKEAVAMYNKTAAESKSLQAVVKSLKRDIALLSKQMQMSETSLAYCDTLRTLQMKERNILLVELSDQLIVLRRKSEKEEYIANYIKAHDPTTKPLDKKLISFSKRKEILLPSLKLDLMIAEDSTSTLITDGVNLFQENLSPESKNFTKQDQLKELTHQATDRLFESMNITPKLLEATISQKEAEFNPLEINNVRSLSSMDTDIPFYPDTLKQNSRYAFEFIKSNDVGHEGLIFNGHEDGINDLDGIITLVKKGGKMDVERLNNLKLIRKEIIKLITEGANEKDKKNLELATSKKKDSKFRGRALLMKSAVNYFQ